jgi:hypothetical protein
MGSGKRKKGGFVQIKFNEAPTIGQMGQKLGVGSYPATLKVKSGFDLPQSSSRGLFPGLWNGVAFATEDCRIKLAGLGVSIHAGIFHLFLIFGVCGVASRRKIARKAIPHG